ncbi:MAG: type II toxin-antitoxin system VapC family toxin [Candidatus Parabeggiatoa sp.]|nr:type II toxin-antitoxin system VapC family toxin [Candidatus Parabeggiatoa sp.]
MTESRYYFDANALLKYYHPLLKQHQEEMGILQIRRLVSRSALPILISPMTSLEVVGKLTQFFRQGLIKRKNLNTIITLLKKETGTKTTIRPFEMVELPDNVFRLAERMLLEHAKFAIGSNDALHLAIVQKLPLYQPIMVTSDKSLQRVCESIQVLFYDPEISIEP